MLDDFRIPREFGFVGGTLLFLVGASILLSVKTFTELPFNQSLAIQIAYNSLGPDSAKQLVEDIRKDSEKHSTETKIDLLGITLWSVGILMSLVRSLRGLQFVVAGILSKFLAKL